MVSIVTGTLNRINILKQVIDNTINTNKSLELVLIDGGSNDGTIEYIKNLNHEQIKFIEYNKRSYYWDFMNLGVKNSKYEYICQWNDDVLLENDWSEVINELNNDFDFYIFSWNESLDKYVIYDDNDNFVLNYGIYNKKIFRQIGLYNNSYKYYYCDGDMSYRAKCFDYKYKKLYNIRCNSLTNHTEKKAYVENNSLELENYYNCLEKYKNKILPDNIEFL
jgi:glycosyltransferase involved in cell wall biosynthesis